ncbi:19917_t:CDS:2 [Cetraspora pellucida]|uniref:19917_t:CDS:1 n=1 Tax=Cetraspora pellucida TaxID=1433469 RepID=A0A9N8WLU6_9GLOM|nr:19917_t:CDS:2 [Cetraspora pellucida]
MLFVLSGFWGRDFGCQDFGCQDSGVRPGFLVISPNESIQGQIENKPTTFFTFSTWLAVAKAKIASKAIISRCFVQRLLLHLGKKLDKDLVALIMEYYNNSGRPNINSFQQNGNDMELFHFLSAGPYALKEAKAIMMKNLDQQLQLTGTTNPEEVFKRLSELIKFGFELDYTVIV